jgi:hypothetical protein
MLKGSYYKFVPLMNDVLDHDTCKSSIKCIPVSFAQLPHVFIGNFNPAKQAVEVNGTVLTQVRLMDPLVDKKIPASIDAFERTFKVGKRIKPKNSAVPGPMCYELLYGKEQHFIAVLEFPLHANLEYGEPVVKWRKWSTKGSFLRQE